MTDKLAPITDQQFPLLAAGEENAKAVTLALRENVGEVGLFDLSSIKFPSGGGTTWEVETLEEPKAEKKLSVVILAAQTARAYYATSIEESGGNTPPDCSSPDGTAGHGTPGGDCAACPFAAWGSGRDGRGKACQERKQLLILTEYGALPYLLSVPPTSLKALRKYMLALTGQSLPYYGVVTELSLTKSSNAAGIEYAELVCRFLRPLSEGEAAVAKEYRAALSALLATLPPPTE